MKFKIITTSQTATEYIVEANNQEDAEAEFQAGHYNSTKELRGLVDAMEEVYSIEEVK